MTAGTLVRAGRPEDLTALMALDQLCFRPGRELWGEVSWREELAGEQVDVDVVEVDGQLAAMASYWSDDELVQLVKVMVHPRVRGRGLARDLILRGIERGRSRGQQRMVLEVRNDNPGAARLYAGLGFQPLSVRKNYYAPGADALVLELIFDAGSASPQNDEPKGESNE